MKKFLKNNILIIISVLLLSIISINSCLTEFRERDTNKLNYKTYVEECKSYNGEYGTEELKNWCENVINNPTIKFNFFEVLSDLIGWHSEILRNLGIALLLVPSIYAMTRLKQKNAYNYIIREDYKKYKNRIYKNGFKYIWLLPSLFILMVVLVGFYTKFNFSVESTNAIVWSANSTNNIFLFLMCYILQLVILSGIYLNIALIITRKQKNFFISLIATFLAILGIELFLEVGINGIVFSSIFKSGFGILFNIVDIYYLNTSYGLIPNILVLLGLYIIIWIIKIVAYKNKEKLVLDCEK